MAPNSFLVQDVPRKAMNMDEIDPCSYIFTWFLQKTIVCAGLCGRTVSHANFERGLKRWYNSFSNSSSMILYDVIMKWAAKR